MSVDSRLLIKQIEARRPLWDREDKNYCHKQIISKLWEEIALVHGVHGIYEKVCPVRKGSESRVKSRWKALRDTYRQEVKKNPQQSMWSYYPDMQFLRGQLKTLPLAPNRPGGNDEDSGDMIFVKTEPETGDWAVGGEEGRECDEQGFAPEDEPDSSRDLKNLDDDDLHFLLSLLPEMRKLPPRQKLPLRIKMMELVYKEAYQQEKSETSGALFRGGTF